MDGADIPRRRERPVPRGRITRFARIGGAATSVAGSAAVDGLRRVAQGEPKVKPRGYRREE